MSDTLSGQFNMLNQLYKQSEEIYHDFSVRCGLSDSSLWLLYALNDAEKPLTQAEICGEWSISKQTLNSAIKKMKDGGYITLESIDTNKKTKHIVLTPSGYELAQQTAGSMAQAERQALADLTNEEREMLVSLSEKHLNFLKREFDKIK